MNTKQIKDKEAERKTLCVWCATHPAEFTEAYKAAQRIEARHKGEEVDEEKLTWEGEHLAAVADTLTDGAPEKESDIELLAVEFAELYCNHPGLIELYIDEQRARFVAAKTIHWVM